MRAYVLAGLIAVTPTEAAAFCSKPSFYEIAPDAPDDPPSVPYCLREMKWSGRHTCDDWELDRYRRAINDYIDELNDFIRDSTAFADEAIQFSEEASRYARCQADEALSQHE